ncbi:MAG: hypothetical protein ACI396_03370 [Acutalibacteraceae bacterium]
MPWFNPFGFVAMVIIMIPNIVFAIKCKDGFENLYQNKAVIILEQIGRYGCFFTMIINVPYTSFGFNSVAAFFVYIAANAVLILAYCIIFIVCFRKNNLFRAIALSVLPTAVFLLSGILSCSVLLTVFALIFAPCHIIVSCKNVLLAKK